MLSKKHCKAIAEIIKAEVDHWEKKLPPVQVALIAVAGNLANYFYKDNQRFDRDKFMTACGLD